MCIAWLQADHLGREMQAFLLGYLLISICEIFSVGGFPLNDKVRLVSKRPIPRDKFVA